RQMTNLLPHLCSLLKKAPPSQRATAADVVGTFGEQFLRLLPLVRADLKALVITSSDEKGRTSAVEALAQIGTQPKTTIAAHIAGLAEELPVLRAGAAHALGELGAVAKPAIHALIPVALRDPDFRARLEAAVALWRIDRRVSLALPVLIE